MQFPQNVLKLVFIRIRMSTTSFSIIFRIWLSVVNIYFIKYKIFSINLPMQIYAIILIN